MQLSLYAANSPSIRGSPCAPMQRQEWRKHSRRWTVHGDPQATQHGSCIGSIIVSSGGIFLVWRTLISTNKSVIETRRSNDISAATQRPWVIFEASLEGQPSLNSGAKFVFLPLALKITNEGTGPAIDTHIWIDAFQTKSFDFFVEYERVIESYKPAQPVVDEPIFKEKTRKYVTGSRIDIRDAEGDIVICITIFYRSPASSKLHHTSVLHYLTIRPEGNEFFGDDLAKIAYHFKMV